MTLYRKQLGQAGEELAAQLLLRKGYRILARNLKTRYGEVDLLAADGLVAVIVEVKTKSNLRFGRPVEMVDRRKQLKLRLLATLLASRYHFTDYRIDIVAVDLTRPNQPQIEHYIAAV